MRPLAIVQADPLADDALGSEAVRQFVQIDGLVFQRAPQTFDEDVVQAAAPSVHRDRDLGVPEYAGEAGTGELASLVCVEDFRLAMTGHRLLQGLDTEPRIHGVRQPPRQGHGAKPVGIGGSNSSRRDQA